MANGDKISRKQEQAIAALLTYPTMTAAAESIGLNDATLCRWMKEEDFQAAYKQARTDALSQAVGLLQANTGKAARVLLDVAESEDSPASSRVAAAKSIIEMAAKFRESEEIEARIAELEKRLGGAT